MLAFHGLLRQDRNGWWVNTLVAFPVTLVLSVGMGIFATGTESVVDFMKSRGPFIDTERRTERQPGRQTDR